MDSTKHTLGSTKRKATSTTQDVQERTQEKMNQASESTKQATDDVRQKFNQATGDASNKADRVRPFLITSLVHHLMYVYIHSRFKQVITAEEDVRSGIRKRIIDEHSQNSVTTTHAVSLSG